MFAFSLYIDLALMLSLSIVYVTGRACVIPNPLLRNDRSLHLKPPRYDGRIVGGYLVNVTDIPYQVSLQRNGHFCGGSIISQHWILTAAHCTYHKPVSDITIRLGSTQTKSGGELLKVKKIVEHDDYNNASLEYDFALIELYKTIEFDDKKRAVRLPPENDKLLDGDLCMVSGWGRTQNDSDMIDWLHATQVPIFNHTLCKEKYKNFGGVSESMICAGFLAGGKDSCQGDSGGPLVHNGMLVGVVSWGFGCAKPDFPGVYSHVTKARKWIKENSGV